MVFLQQLLLLSSFAMANPPAFGTKPINVRLHPLSLIVGVYQASVDIPISEQLTVGPEASYLKNSIEGVSFTATSVGVRSNYFLNGVFTNGVYVAPAASMEKMSASSESGSADVNAISIRAIVGYGWFKQNLNFMVGAGLGQSVVTGKVEDEDVSLTSTGQGLILELSVGWKL